MPVGRREEGEAGEEQEREAETRENVGLTGRKSDHAGVRTCSGSKTDHQKFGRHYRGLARESPFDVGE